MTYGKRPYYNKNNTNLLQYVERGEQKLKIKGKKYFYCYM